MAKQTETKKTVNLTSPQGTKVTVAADAAEKYKAKGYKGVGGRPAKSADEK